MIDIEMYEYFVSYAHKNGFGNCTVAISERVKGKSGIEFLEMMIYDSDETLEDVVLINYKLL